MTAIDWKPGMVARCIDNSMPADRFEPGENYSVATVELDFLGFGNDPRDHRRVRPLPSWHASRFKPVYRVKAVGVPDLATHIARAMVALFKLTPAEQQEHWEEQKMSWLRGEMGRGSD